MFIFGNVNISGIVASIIGFTLVFGISVYNILKTGVNAIDKGQFEAAYALGHSYYSTFYRIILP
ncbi:MAG: ABC transporter permease subunit, partial [Lachnospiraceae bacterium]|nr:ABC transporter permease subunit [Lachnospiraceae bacterium]